MATVRTPRSGGRTARSGRLGCMTLLACLALIASSCSGSGSAASPTTSESTAAESTAAESTATESTTTEPSTTEPSTTEPTSTTTMQTTTTEPPVELASGPSAGCSSPEPQRLPSSMVTADGTDRTFRISLPFDYDQETPMPVVFDFHGLGSAGFQQAIVSGVDLEANSRGYIAVIPDGAKNETLDTRAWNLTTSSGGAPDNLAVDDIAFTAELLDLVQEQLCVDTGRVFSMGMSNGGFFSSVLACELADRFAAVATIAGITHPDSCDPVRPVPLLHFHGTDDDVVPFGGGESSLIDSAVFDHLTDEQIDEFADQLFQPIEAEVAEWAATDQCAVEPRVVEVSSTVERRIYESCGEADVEFYVIDGGGHTWPGSIVMGFVSSLGATTMDISATSLAFDWFDAHPMPAS